jgi:hypothetical protein
MEECTHIKVYSNCILTSYPPQSPWICPLCGYRGVDRGAGGMATGPTYAELVEKFKRSNLNGTEEQADHH